MNSGNSFFSGIYNMVASFGEAYSEAAVMLFNSVFSRPLRFIYRRIKRLLRFIFRGIAIFFAPAAASSEAYADDVTRAFKRCLKILFTHPFSLPSVIWYYIKKALSRYEYSLKNAALWVLPLLISAAVIIGAGAVSGKTLCLEIISDGEVLGAVADEQGFIRAKNSAREMLLTADKAAILPSVSYALAIRDKNSLTGVDELRDRLVEKSAGSGVQASGVFIDGEFFGALASEAEGRAVLSELLEAHKTEGSFVASFAQEIEFRQGLYAESSLLTKNEFRKALSDGEESVSEYTVKENDTPESVSFACNMSVAELLSLNGLPEDTVSLEAGSTVKVYDRELILTLKEVKAEITAEETDFETVEIKTNALYSGTERILLEGKKGYDQVTNLVTVEGGKKVSSREVYRLNVTKPVAQRVQIGTKPLDEAYSNSMGGIFLWPIIGAYGINSDYGYRWGKLHGGIDLGMGNDPGTSLGKTVIAVAQGTVIVAGTHSSYGYYVIIDHGGGLQTLYAHCLANSLMVVPGQIVAAGEPIARVGSTGYSTGPHLHFEVRVNGNRINPRPYLGI